MKRTLIIFIIVNISLPGFSQLQLWRTRRLELTAGIGTTHFFSDIGRFSSSKNPIGIRDLSFVNTGINITGNARYRLTRNFSLRADLAGAYLHASDIHGSRQARNFEVLSNIFQPALMAEYYILTNGHSNSFLFLKNKRSSRSSFTSFLDVYAFAGIGGVLWDATPNPTLALHITNTRGFTAVIPAGIGVSRNFSGNFKGGFEIGGRYALKDNIDSYVSSSDKDSFYFLDATFTWYIKTRKLPSF